MTSKSLKIETRKARSDFRVALVNMPFGSAQRPSIQLGLLAVIGEAAGFQIDTHYLNLNLASEIGLDVYDHLCMHRGYMTGDWLFAVAAFGQNATRPTDSYFDAFPSERRWSKSIGQDTDFLVKLRSTVLPAYIRRCVSDIEWNRYAVVGFTTTFQQNVASLALASAIKKRFPDVRIVFGGANMDGDMGVQTLRAFPFVDMVVSGEGELAFPNLLCALEGNNDPSSIPGVLTRELNGQVTGEQAPPYSELDQLPTPDYSAYFDQARALGLLDALASKLNIPFEGSRGCWWGAKHHCTFCGLNGAGMSYRSKTPQRVMVELGELSVAYHVTAFEAVDNILDRGYLNTLFAEIAENKLDFRFFFEVKANMGREEIRKLAMGGVREVQPGIESMSTAVLRLMRKGCTMLQNVLCLKWCTYYGIGVSWNLLFGFPGESEQDYVEQLSVLKNIAHLQPPNGFDRIWLERFSPYYTNADQYGVRNIRPTNSYEHVYPDYVALDQIAYFFDYEMPEALGEHETHVPMSILEATRTWVSHWQEIWSSDNRFVLSYRRTPQGVLVDSARGSNDRTTVSLSGPAAEMLVFCGEAIRSAQAVKNHLLESCKEDLSLLDVREALHEFCNAGLMLSENDKFLALPLPSNPNW